MAGAESRMAWTTKTGEALCTKTKQDKGGGASKRSAVKSGGASPKEAEKDTAADSVSSSAAAASGAVEGDTPRDEWVPVAGLSTMRLPQEYVDFFLPQKRKTLKENPDDYYNRMINDPVMVDIFTEEYIEDTRELLRSIAAQFQRLGDRLERFQAYSRLQLDEKGYVEVNGGMEAAVRLWCTNFGDLKLDDQDPAGAGAVAVESN